MNSSGIVLVTIIFFVDRQNVSYTATFKEIVTVALEEEKNQRNINKGITKIINFLRRLSYYTSCCITFHFMRTARNV